jgi:hypothetical protein
MHLHITNPMLLQPFHPFSDVFHCYAGSQWFVSNAKAAAVLLAPETDRLLKYFSGRFPPDEAVCPTILGNAPQLRIKGESKHYIRWEEGHHPRLLSECDLPEMLASRAHFARKFSHKSRVLDILDEHIGIKLHETSLRAG